MQGTMRLRVSFENSNARLAREPSMLHYALSARTLNIQNATSALHCYQRLLGPFPFSNVPECGIGLLGIGPRSNLKSDEIAIAVGSVTLPCDFKDIESKFCFDMRQRIFFIGHEVAVSVPTKSPVRQ